ncbi:hypothetical protein [Leucothrix arctica]|uniref:Uncharacterized protein n=1 Tax=Leucothrix arctica TaxID=1481894 RepID=A0A317CG27_9GAMM|nr:hypothetical protein [Leucothrix arctica]PWQ97515.1 hypothetical protein DKT75_06215 [Leucothrix arctica]
MSTVCKICVKAKEDDIVTFLEETLFDMDHEFTINVTGQALTQIERDSFLVGVEHPSIFSCTQATYKTTEIHFNSFNKMKKLSAILSEKINGIVIVNIYQSTASAGSWLCHDKGELLREIEFGDGEISIDSGVKFDFEADKIGTDISEAGEEECYVFGADDMDLYNHKLGLGVEVYQNSPAEWTNFKIDDVDTAPLIACLPSEKKWWKVW